MKVLSSPVFDFSSIYPVAFATGNHLTVMAPAKDDLASSCGEARAKEWDAYTALEKTEVAAAFVLKASKKTSNNLLVGIFKGIRKYQLLLIGSVYNDNNML